MTPIVEADSGDIGWEEMILASSAHLLRTCLSKKGGSSSSNQTNMEPIESTDKLKRQVQAIYERVKNGGILTL